MADGRDGTPQGRSNKPIGSKKALANEHRLRALGDAVDRQTGVQRHGRQPRRPNRRRRRVLMALASVVALIVVIAGGAYFYANYRFDQIPKIHVASDLPQLAGKPFNILEIGSDSRAGLTGKVAVATGASDTPGQRSDVVKIMHIDPEAGTISVLSIPRDTMVTLLANQSLYGQFNRINVNFANGPSLLVKTIEANFGIPIQHVIVVSFAGLINSIDAIGGIYLDFRYPAKDEYSGLNIKTTGCQLVTRFQALAVARSRHYEWYQNGVWNYDGTSDFGRILRQDAFMRAMINRVRGLYNPLSINNFLSKIPQGITLDDQFTLRELVALAVKFHGINPNAMLTYTLPTVAGVNPTVGDVLYEDQPAAQQMLVDLFGSSLLKPTNPPPNAALQTPPPPTIAPTTTTSTTTTTLKSSGKSKGTTTTTTTIPPLAVAGSTQATPAYDPVPCSP
jgi:LCP family protein required for cell wall assembly